jgi:hypothetical protein
MREIGSAVGRTSRMPMTLAQMLLNGTLAAMLMTSLRVATLPQRAVAIRDRADVGSGEPGP